jgi:hypothetical protein
MRTVRVDKNREVEVPETYAEGEALLTHVMGAGPWIPERSATCLREADLNVLS